MQIKYIILWLILAALPLIGVIFYRSRHESNLNVTPNAAEEIQKAKRR